jgi:hypothetical protein
MQISVGSSTTGPWGGREKSRLTLLSISTAFRRFRFIFLYNIYTQHVSCPWRQLQVLVVRVPAQKELGIEMGIAVRRQSPVVDCSRDVDDYGVSIGRAGWYVNGHDCEYAVSEIATQ